MKVAMHLLQIRVLRLDFHELNPFWPVVITKTTEGNLIKNQKISYPRHLQYRGSKWIENECI